MYRPAAFQEDDVDKLVAFMQANSFATLVTIAEGVPCATHVPLVVQQDEQGLKLLGHFAKANPQWRSFSEAESLAIFAGAHAYISPQLYEQRENVPTWNYIAVHAYGRPRLITFDRAAPEPMETMIDTMVNTYEASYHDHWHGLSERYRQRMMQGMMGFEMPITRIEGKYKLSQNRSHADQAIVTESLLTSTDPAERAIGEEMQKNLGTDT